MVEAQRATVDGNEAVASVAYRTNEVIAVYPITPSSTMGELADEWSAKSRRNLWGSIPQVVEMQSEAGAAGAIHGALQAGALATTFTASQGLLLMIPNLYKIAGELTACCIHVAARTVATHALSIFGDHSDVMACRATGFAMLSSGSVQEAHDFACIAQAATFEARVPFLHFFDGFRTSHEVTKIALLSDDDLRALLPDGAIAAHRARGLTPDRPVVRGTAQNPDTFFQAREAANPFHDAVPAIVEQQMARFAERTGRRYLPYEYFGAPDAQRVVVLMGSGAQTARATVEALCANGEKVGVLVVRLFRPFAAARFVAAIPASVKSLIVLDRTKEPGSVGDPLYLDVIAALSERPAGAPTVRVIGGRYGLSSKEFTPAMVKACLDEAARMEPKNHFTVGIVDDVTQRSLDIDPEFELDESDVVRCVFHGLGADGTVGANKGTIKIVGDHSDREVQGYFVYDSKKSGARTVSHLRFSRRPIRTACLIRRAGFVACHQFHFLDRVDVLATAELGATFLLNSPYGAEEVFERLPREVQEQLIEKRLDFYVVDAHKIAREAGIDGRINTPMQVCFFHLTGLMPIDEAIAAIEQDIAKSYGKKGDEIVRRNVVAARAALAHLQQVRLPERATAHRWRPPVVPEHAPDFVQRVTAMMLADQGDLLPVSAFPPDGTWPSGTARFEKRDIATAVPVWDPAICVQCNKCAFVCPHSAIRVNVYPESALVDPPDGFLSTPYHGREHPGHRYTVQVTPDDCTGCKLCAIVCPAKDRTDPRHRALEMAAHDEVAARERERFAYFEKLPLPPRESIERVDVKGSQFLAPLFEFSGACAGCGETPYVRLLSQLFGDRLVVANATGCSSIYGGNLPTTPWCTDANGRGPAWSNSLFEDNAEFGLGMRLALDSRATLAREKLAGLASLLPGELVAALQAAEEPTESARRQRRVQVESLRTALARLTTPDAALLASIVDDLVRKSVWLIGGDGWAYDIGFGGLDHVLASGRAVKALVLDTEVYSNTGGQQSKATPLGASAKFAVLGKEAHKKDLGLIAMSYGNVYVASIAFGAKDAQTVQALQEAESYPGPALVIAYSHCIAHGYDLSHGLDQQHKAVASGIWPLYRYDPRRVAQGLPPLQLDSGAPTVKVRDYMAAEARFRMVERADPVRFQKLAVAAQAEMERRLKVYEHLAKLELAKQG